MSREDGASPDNKGEWEIPSAVCLPAPHSYLKTPGRKITLFLERPFTHNISKNKRKIRRQEDKMRALMFNFTSLK